MADVKIFHTGDFHIGSSRTGVKNGRAEIINTFFRTIDLCKSEHIDFLLIAGDLFDTPFPDSDTAEEVIHAMTQIPETIIAISPGNHDCACPGSVWLKYTFPKNVYIFTAFGEYIDFPEKNVRLFGAAFTDRYEKLPLLSTIKDLSNEAINLCVLHGDIISGTSESNYNPITADAIKNCNFDYLALGHIHKRTEVTKLGNTYYSYCGCPDGRGFDEDGSHGAYIGSIGKNNCKLEYIELSSRKYIIDNFNISGLNTSLEVSDKILDYIKSKYENHNNNLYRISLVGTISTDFVPNTSQIESALSDHLTYIRISDNTDTDFSDIEKIANESSLRGIFIKKIIELSNSADDKDSEIYRQAIKLGLKAFEKGVTLNDN